MVCSEMMFSYNTTESCKFKVTEHVYLRSRSQYSDRANLRFVVKEGVVLREGFLYVIISVGLLFC